MTDRVDYDEFGLFHENAAEYGLPFGGPPTVRRVFADVAVACAALLHEAVDGTGVPTCRSRRSSGSR